jgi:hypothetical protein
MDIRELAKEFTSMPGNSVVSSEMLVNFYKFLQDRGIEDQIVYSKLGVNLSSEYWKTTDPNIKISYELTKCGFKQTDNQ